MKPNHFSIFSIPFSTALAIAIITFRPALADTVVVPSAAEGVDQPNAVADLFPPSGAHIQYVYDNNDLLQAMPDGGFITGIAYRLDADFGRPVDTTVNVEIFMSTTQAAPPSSLNFVFAENRGPDFQNVFARNDFQLNASFTAGTAHPFDLGVPFSSPFFYNPRGGNLLIETYVFKSANNLVAVDAARAGAVSHWEGEPSLGAAPVIQLTFEPVPEPHLFVPCVGTLLIYTLTRKKRELA
jgi:hypothetical protein